MAETTPAGPGEARRAAAAAVPGGAGVRLADFDAAIFDLDGVVTRTARLHAASWKRLFDAYLAERAERTGEPFRPFDLVEDYARHVDGKPRQDGVAAFLRSRGIVLEPGTPDDPPERETVAGLGKRKNRHFRAALARDGVAVFDTTVAFIGRLRRRHAGTALVSSSRNARAVLAAAGLEDLFDVVIDGNDLARLGLKGKPAPDLFLEAARRLGAEPGRAIVFEDAVSGVEAGAAGGFGLVVGLDRQGRAAALKAAGADLVVDDVARLHVRDKPAAPCRMAQTVEHALERFGAIAARLAGRRAAVFLDYDGTLTPIVARPELAVLEPAMRATVERLAGVATVAIVSGRDRADVQRLVGLDGLVYAGSHGFDIAGPDGLRIRHEEGAAFEAEIAAAARRLQTDLADIDGVLVEPKRFAVAVHHRQVAAGDVGAVEAAVDAAAAAMPALRKTYGKKVFELRPRLDWDKGRAVAWLIEALGLGDAVLPFYLGDDVTDEDAFAALGESGIGILVGCPERETAARYRLDDTAETRRFLARLGATLEAARDG
ncbi:trehalose-phosphatase [Aquibium sp. A9E412]|uniref:trehalose-phosphatase n=1 Tax=Aquibium sp. A9E412 TaxID=2976767 RepID=UPI0025B19500|nr:trehalose-phosphatase [Aquibium sp. A9E412]MDN2565553.1 trehalose-phosphatase [Aquibium sp. A9E412]